MSDRPTKADVRTRVRESVTACPACGKPYDDVFVNSHETADPADCRFYFLFAHGDDECRDYTKAPDLESWLEKASSAGG